MNIKKREYINGEKNIEILTADSLESLIKADAKKYQEMILGREELEDKLCKHNSMDCEICNPSLAYDLHKNLSPKKLNSFENEVEGKGEIEDLGDHDYCQLNYRYGKNNGIIYINHFVLDGDGSGPHGEQSLRVAKYKRIID